MGSKTCILCGTDISDRYAKNGRAQYCKPCAKTHKREYTHEYSRALRQKRRTCKQHLCRDCGADLSGRAGNTKRCFACAAKHHKLSMHKVRQRVAKARGSENVCPHPEEWARKAAEASAKAREEVRSKERAEGVATLRQFLAKQVEETAGPPDFVRCEWRSLTGQELEAAKQQFETASADPNRGIIPQGYNGNLAQRR